MRAFLKIIFMNKEAYYFPHYSNSRSDVRLLKLRRVKGAEAYGVYYMLLEVLREQDDNVYSLSNIDELEYELRVSKELILSVIHDFNLFVIADNVFYSEMLTDSLKAFRDKQAKARNAALARWKCDDESENTNNECKEKNEQCNTDSTHTDTQNVTKTDAIQTILNSRATEQNAQSEDKTNVMQNDLFTDAKQNNTQSNDNADAMQMQCVCNASKVKKSKVNKRKEKESGVFLPPTHDDIKNYFVDNGLNGQSETEARKFFNYYENADWKIGRKNTKMKNWKLAASNWIENMKQFSGIKTEISPTVRTENLTVKQRIILEKQQKSAAKA